MWLIFSGWFFRADFAPAWAAVCFWLLSIDGSREQLLDGDKKHDARGSHSTFYHSRGQREVEGTSQNSLNQRCFHVLWFQWLNHRPAPTEPCVPHPIPPSESPTGPAMSWTKPTPLILIKLAVAFLETSPMAKRGDKDDLLQISGRTSLLLSPFHLIIWAGSAVSSSHHQNIQVGLQPYHRKHFNVIPAHTGEIENV